MQIQTDANTDGCKSKVPFGSLHFCFIAVTSFGIFSLCVLFTNEDITDKITEDRVTNRNVSGDVTGNVANIYRDVASQMAANTDPAAGNKS